MTTFCFRGYPVMMVFKISRPPESDFIDLIVTVLMQGVFFVRTVRIQGEAYD